MPLHGFSRTRAAGISRAAFTAIMVLAGLIGPMVHVAAAPISQSGAPGETIFQAKCVACHTLGKGKLVGPDLKDVTARRDAQWLKSIIADPNKLFAANDPTAMQLLSEYNNVKMPALGLTDAEVNALVVYLGSASSTAGSVAAPVAQATAGGGDPASGHRVFTGELALANSGPSCIGCHTVSGIGSLGGGALGPDLTHAAQRYPGPGLAAVLGNVAFPTMVGPFTNRPLTPQEQADLVAFLVQADQGQMSAPAVAAGAITLNTWWVLGIGLAGTAALTLLLAIFWPRQRQSISARLRDTNRPEQA
jgi:mono/diheme cytochrome c family protein